MPPSRKQQVVDLLKSLETKNQVPFAYVNPNKYIQHNLQVGPGPEGVAALIQKMPPDASVNTIRVFENGDYVFAATKSKKFTSERNSSSVRDFLVADRNHRHYEKESRT